MIIHWLRVRGETGHAFDLLGHLYYAKRMATLARADILAALARLGELAEQQGQRIELLVVGGAAMVLAYNARLSTRDVDAVAVPPPEAQVLRTLVRAVASERGWADDWLNDGAKGYLIGVSRGPTVFTAPGIEVRIPSVPQLLAMKLSAWRDDVDIEDARRLLSELEGERDVLWQAVEPYLVPGDELKAYYAFLDLWESLHGAD